MRVRAGGSTLAIAPIPEPTASTQAAPPGLATIASRTGYSCARAGRADDGRGIHRDSTRDRTARLECVGPLIAGDWRGVSSPQPSILGETAMTTSSNDSRSFRPGDRVRADDRSGILFVVCHTGIAAEEWAHGEERTVADTQCRPDDDVPRDDDVVVTVQDLALELHYGDEVRDWEPWDIGERVFYDRAEDAPTLLPYPRSRLEPVDYL